ncbi:MAG: hypothetical protein MRJ65_14160 [Candidatus Brocadiaceae bacterium]|nr:hypothetical protein [Candidatus Brocadiaceae bacterium]
MAKNFTTTISDEELERLLARAGRDKAQRTCLKCGVSFLSESKGNRICRDCHAKKENTPDEYFCYFTTVHRLPKKIHGNE